ncbi:XisI protein [Nostoc sp. UCD121]|uniref:XisI protein n=1 Tax=unclassified Nostoc TaxID=2593658 RepID=UPI001628AFAB|nr:MULTISPECIES: XisI protein [unclassified Nostoc]MBC1222102.1 XisI protein [Nostoc sp. UCD120]MBC1278672.1 XisI protein [Nostoc sp. UCD121]
MDKLSKYRNIIKNILIEYDRLCNSSPDEDLESLLALDDERDQYLWFQIGWQKDRRIKGITVHIRIKNHKIWIEEDWTEEGIATELLNAGVPQSDIVLAFHPPSDRALTEFAPA